MGEEREFVGARLDAGLRAARFSSPPSADEFAADVEPKNVPAVFRDVAKGWAASSRWDPLHGGLDYLLEKVGPDVAVEAMMSNTGHVFYGDLRSHERVSVSFSTFIQSCKSYLNHMNAASDSSKEQGMLGEPACSREMCSNSSENLEQVYLAQVSIMNAENKERCSLQVLKGDIQEPIFLRGKSFSSINFWMNKGHLRSSTHYDPHHNLLCVVSGCKKGNALALFRCPHVFRVHCALVDVSNWDSIGTPFAATADGIKNEPSLMVSCSYIFHTVTLWPPSASPFLYPLPVYGEASNHSSVSMEEPDYSIYTRARYMKEYSETVILNCGDVVFIPEGWYHQVDSDDLTIAVNFWWKSRIMTQMLEHMDAYYLRRILSRLVDQEMSIMVQSPFVHSKDCTDIQRMAKTLTGFQLFSLQKDSPLRTLEPSTLQALYELISLVHDGAEVVSQNDKTEATSQHKSSDQRDETKTSAAADDSSLLDKDPVAKIILPVEPLELRSMLLAMVHTFPRTVESLVLNMLGPVGAEILTRKFDEMDQQTTKEEQAEFYKIFYSVFDDQYAAMDALLNGKELFSFQIFQNVLDKYLRVHVDRPS